MFFNYIPLIILAQTLPLLLTMETISKYIGDLLMRQDDVIVPNLGGFVARRIPARRSVDGLKVSPPYKQLLFHAHLNLSDGIFERYVANRSKTTIQEAVQNIAFQVAEWNLKLKNGERIEFDKVGYLFTDKDNKVRFEQDRSYNLLLQAYGLGEIVFEKKVEEIAQTVIQNNQREVKEMEGLEVILEPIHAIDVEKDLGQEDSKIVLVQDAVSGNKNTRALWLKVAAAAVLLPFAFYSFWVPMTTDVLATKKLAFSDFNPFHKLTKARYSNNQLNWIENNTEQINDLDEIVASLPEDALFYNFNYDEELILPVRLERKKLVASALDQSIESERQVHPISKNKIHLISGCFSQKENAENHIQSLQQQGFDAYLVDVHGGLHRVAALGVFEESELSVASKKLAEKEINFWTLKK